MVRGSKAPPTAVSFGTMVDYTPRSTHPDETRNMAAVPDDSYLMDDVESRRWVAEALLEILQQGQGPVALRDDPPTELLGFGSSGYAFLLQSGRVLKVTESDNEYGCLVVTQGRELGPHFPRVDGFGSWSGVHPDFDDAPGEL